MSPPPPNGWEGYSHKISDGKWTIDRGRLHALVALCPCIVLELTRRCGERHDPDSNGNSVMYPLDAVYGPKCYHAFDPNKGFPKRQILTSTLQTPDEVWGDAPIKATSYAELVDIVSFLAVMNKRHALYFRGQGKD